MEELLLIDESVALTRAQETASCSAHKAIDWTLPSEMNSSIIGWIDDTWEYTYHLANGQVI
ncbi:hypothetical protein GCM10028805_37820 [Spirosoma harenae]